MKIGEINVRTPAAAVAWRTLSHDELVLFADLRAVEDVIRASGDALLADRLYVAGLRIGALVVDLKHDPQ